MDENIKPIQSKGSAEVKKGQEVQEIKSNLEKAKKLTLFCYENGNPIHIIDYGENFDLNNSEINPDILKKLNEEEIRIIRAYLKAFKVYLNGLTFTDSFGENNDLKTGRSGWEKNKTGINLMDKNLLELYNSNKLRVVNSGNMPSYLEHIIRIIENSEIKNKLLEIKKLIPYELIDRVDGDADKTIIYSSCEDKRKIDIIKKLDQIVKELISFFEGKEA